jgi:hypothetical protein
MSRSNPPGRHPRGAGPGRVRDARAAGAREPVRTGDAQPSGWMLPGVAPEDLDPDSDELREFLAADLLPAEADPVFKERLRLRLWRLVQARYGRRTD